MIGTQSECGVKGFLWYLDAGRDDHYAGVQYRAVTTDPVVPCRYVNFPLTT